MRGHLKNFLALILGLIIACVILEVFLNYKNPFGQRLKGDKIVLLSGRKVVYENDKILGVDTLIVHTKNSLGFRGEERPKKLDNWNSIIAVGGSTTECLYQSDNKDWVSLLGNKLKKDLENIWINNAGLDGHSTFGHEILLKDYLIKLKPDYIMYLVGCNDIGREDLGEYDKRSLKKENPKWQEFLFDNSQLASLLKNLHRNNLAKRKNLSHYAVPSFNTLGTLDRIDDHKIDQLIDYHGSFRKEYKKRLESLVKTTLESNIVPILITQPTLVGSGVDEVTGIDLERIKLCHELGGKAYWQLLESYNDIARIVANNYEVKLVDLAKSMPKSTELFYDCFHYTNQGAEQVSEIIHAELKPYLLSNNLD